ncbi:class I SAM-dependent methyltransferase [Halochromatium glycolicum]|uniref:Class I SAM-dependent methyltransferase n=1 Tax=Halochromatium glycolicum TaxID=85075 RepID=A0AAJ0U536_9GAMM|nr:class I SAM-dependent methyltransferase [Halochromatium glycolicum]MBK1705434.1 hypothetical protein [Halochromatium glycolicum]
MSEFSLNWLQLREEADHRARADSLLQALQRPALATSCAQRPLQILDLGAGTGANLRYLAPKLGSGQQWRCLDHDPILLDGLLRLTRDWASARGYQVDVKAGSLLLAGPAWDAQVQVGQADLAAGLRAQQLPSGGLVTASALLDLVSEPWLCAVVERCKGASCSLLFALSYDGRVRLAPAQPMDQEVIALVNQHQRRDKGFGPALGPSASAAAQRLALAAGYQVQTAPSAWSLEADEAPLQQALLEGWVDAACEVDPTATSRLQAWCAARQAEAAAGGLKIALAHRDLIAVSPDQSPEPG